MKALIKEKQEKLEKLNDKQLPNLELETIEGEKINLLKLKGKPSLINFWFTACQPCIDELPVLNELKKKYNNEVNFISITYENKEDALFFLKQNKFDFKHIINANHFLKKIGIPYYPITIITDKNMVVKLIEKRIPVEEIEKSNEIIARIEKTLNQYK